jgi:hypothetical protein
MKTQWYHPQRSAHRAARAQILSVYFCSRPGFSNIGRQPIHRNWYKFYQRSFCYWICELHFHPRRGPCHKTGMASSRSKSNNTTRSSTQTKRFLSETTNPSPYREQLSESDSDDEFCSDFRILPSVSSPDWLATSPSFSSPSKNNRKSVNDSLIKQVVTDIEEARKIDPSVRPCDVFDTKPDIYGERDSTLRRKAQNIYYYHVKGKSPVSTSSNNTRTSIEAPVAGSFYDNIMSVNMDSGEYISLKKFVPDGFNLKRIGKY